MNSTRLRVFQRGLSLLEVLVALAILAIALTAAMRAIGVATNQTADIRAHMIAEWVALDRIAEHRALGHWVEPGKSNGEVTQASESFRYEEEIKATANPLFRRIDVDVFALGNGSRLAHVTGFISRRARQ